MWYNIRGGGEVLFMHAESKNGKPKIGSMLPISTAVTNSLSFLKLTSESEPGG